MMKPDVICTERTPETVQGDAHAPRNQESTTFCKTSDIPGRLEVTGQNVLKRKRTNNKSKEISFKKSDKK